MLHLTPVSWRRHYVATAMLLVLFSGQRALAAAPVLTVTPNPVTLNCFLDFYGLNKCTQDVVLVSTGSLPFTVGVGVTSGGISNFPSWLSVSPSSGAVGSTGVTLHLTANLLHLASPHTYSGMFTITAPGASNSPLTVPVTLALTGADGLTPKPGAITLNGVAGGAKVSAQVSIATLGQYSMYNPLSFWAAPSPSWLTTDVMNPGSATSAGTSVTLSADPGVLTAKSYNGTVSLTDSAGNNTPLNVTFAVAQPQLTVTTTPPSNPSSSPALGFDCNISLNPVSCTPASGSLQVSSNGNLPFTVTSAVTGNFSGRLNWLTFSPGGGTATSSPSNINVVPIPTGLAFGAYNGTLTITAPGASNSPVVVPVTLNISGGGGPQLTVVPLTVPLSAAMGGPAVSQSVTVKTTQLIGLDTQFFLVSVQPGAPWLTAQAASNFATAGGIPVTLSANPSSLSQTAPNAPNRGTVTLTDSAGNATPVTVALTVNPPPPLSITPGEIDFTYAPGGPQPVSQPVTVTSAIPTTLSQNVSSTGNWLSAVVTGGPTSFTVILSANPTALSSSPTPYCGEVDLTPSNGSPTQKIISCITVSGQTTSSTQVIAHLADGGGWTTRVILVNTDSQPASFQLRFFDESGNPLTLPLGPDGTVSTLTGTIAPASSRVIQSAGLATGPISVGWAQLSGPATVGGTSIFTYNSATEASVALTASGAQQLYIPFDNTTGFSTGLAIANPASQSSVVNVSMFDDAGNHLLTTQITVPANGHWSNNVDHQIPPAGVNGIADFAAAAGRRGVMQVTADKAVYSLGIRGRTGATYLFTSLDALHAVRAGNKSIAHLANGGVWATTIELINTDSTPAPFTINFYDDNGNPLALPLVNQGLASSVSDTIQPGQIRILQTDGSGNFSQGWAQVTTVNAIGGICIFTDGGVSEAAVTVAAGGGKTLYVPYDNTSPFLTGLAMANPNNTNVPLTLTFTSDSGVVFQPQATQTVGARGHAALNLFGAGSIFEGVNNSRGLLRVDSTVDLFGVGIRSRSPANSSVSYFTALPVLPVNP